MDIRQLGLFVAVAEELHFGRAAMRVGIAQPPLSLQIRKLEADLGVELFRRTSRSVTLTAAGEVLLAEARALLQRRDDVVERVRSAATGATGRLRLGFSASSAFGILPGLVSAFRQRYPEVRLNLDDRDHLQIEAGLLSGQLDLAIVRAPYEAPGVRTELFVAEPFAAVIPATHRFASMSIVPPAAFEGEPIVLFPRADSPGLHDTITGLFREAGTNLDIVQEASTWASVVGLVQAGLGITVAPRSAGGLVPHGVFFRPLIAGPRHLARLDLAFVPDRLTPVASNFRELARSMGRRGLSVNDVSKVN